MEIRKGYRIVPAETYDLRVGVSAFMPGEFSDWPANVQDAIEKALARANRGRLVRQLTIRGARCATDPDGHFIHVVAQSDPYIIWEN